MWNLSLLSRGCGDLVTREHERLDVYFEAQDYFNWRSRRNSVCVSLKLHDSEGFLHDHHNPAPPKTYSTRRGALVLYSEELALQSWQRQHGVKWKRMARLRLSTLRDLARAVLAYGRREDSSGPKQVEPYLYFLIGSKNHPGNRKIRPGYSAKRYLACLTETCNPALLHRLRRSGCISDPNLLRGTSLNSFLQQQAKYDLSEVPRPYLVLPCLPFAHLYRTWPCSEEEETALDPGESCSSTAAEDRGMQSDRNRCGGSERWMKRESGEEFEDLRESSLDAVMSIPPSDLQQIKEEAQQVQGTLQGLDRPPPNPLSGGQPDKGRGHGQKSSMLGRPTIDSSQLCSRKSRMTYYGGPLAGARRGLSVKSRTNGQCGSRQHMEPPNSTTGQLQLPPIHSEIGAGLRPIEEDGSGELEMLKLPRTRRRSVAAARHAGRRRGGANPEAAQLKQRLVLPPLMDISHPKKKGEDIQDEGTENKRKLEAPDSTETSRMEGLDQANRIIGDYTISREQSSGLNGGNAGILPEICSHMEIEGKIVGFIGISVEEDESLLEENKGKSEAPDSTETSRMEGLDQADRIIGDYTISREQSSGLNGGNVGILPELSSHMEMEGKIIGFMGIRVEEAESLLEENKGKSEAPDSTETSRMEGLDQADRIIGDYTISREQSSGLDRGNVGILPEISSHMEMEGKIVGFIGIRMEEDGSQVEENKGKSEALDSTETSRMEGLDQANRINEERISRERSSGLDRGNAGILPEISSHMGMEGKMVGFMGIRMEEDGTLLEENKGKSEAPDSTETSRIEGLDQADQINEERISRERRSGLDRGNVGIFPEISSHMGMEGKTVGFMGIRMEEDGTLLEEVGDQSVKPGPVLPLLPPIQEARGPGKHRNKASFRRKARRNKTSSPGIVRGTVPKKLKDVHKDISVGSLLMAPDGEIVRLSLLGPIRGPNGSFMARFPRREGHLPLECGFSDEKVGLVTEQGLEAGDIVYGSDGELCQSPVSTHMNSEQRHTRKAFRQRGRRRTDPDGNSAGRPEDGTARGAKVSSDRRTKGNHQCPVAPGYLEEMMLDEDGNLRQPYQSHQGSVYDSVHEGKAAQDMKHAAQGSNHGKSAVISSLSGWPQTEPSSLSTAEELGTLCSLHAVDDGCSPNPSGRRNLLVKEGLVDTEDSGTDAEDQEAKLWNQLSEGSTGIKTKKQKSKRKKGQKNPNQDPNTQGNDSVPSSFEVPRNSQGPNQTSGPNKPSGPRNSQGPNQTSGPNKPSGPRNSQGPNQTSGPNKPSGPRNSQGPNQTAGPNKPSGPRNSQGPNQASGLNKPSGPRNSQGPNQASGPNKPSGPRNSQGPNQASGLNNERNKNNKRAEFIVGRPRETIGRQRHLPPVKQKTTSKLGKKEAMRGGGDEEEREEDAQPSSEAGGALHSPRRRNTPTSVSAVKAITADQDPNSPFTDTTTKGPATDQGRRRERTGESPLGTSAVPGSKHLIQSGSSRLEGRQRPNGEQQDRSEQRRLELEKQIQQELDDDQRRKEEEIRNKKQQHEHEARQQQEAEQSRRHREQQEREWDQRQREEYRRKVQEIQHRKERSLAERAEETERLQREWQKQLEEEEQLLKGMDEPQRLEYLRLKQIKEQQEKEYQEERRRKEGERSKCLMEEAMQEAVFLLRQKGLMERDLMFHRNLLVEVIGLEQSQSITRPWVFSYFELIEFLGQETPVEEIMKESSHSGQWD
ncbi:uncharacterized protein [Heterodontus francisci]|uniref:uncharacterized protein isoform X2 n=1 Tax=Heterodontus francisci TaxID=7792 RepID=UPI00355B6B77